jgi:hypothetical protein
MLLADAFLAASSAFIERRSVSRQALALPLLGLLLGTGLGVLAQFYVLPGQLNYVFVTQCYARTRTAHERPKERKVT